jgi:hemin uptake protein HemP
MKAPLPVPTTPPQTPSPATGTPSPLESAALFRGRDEILIAHGGETYRLRRTRQGKLILTK